MTTETQELITQLLHELALLIYRQSRIEATLYDGYYNKKPPYVTTSEQAALVKQALSLLEKPTETKEPTT